MKDDLIIRQEEAIVILSDMKIDIPVPKAATTQRKRNVALDMAISALKCSEIPNNSDTISRQAAIQTAEQMYKRCDTSSIEDYHDLMVEALTALPSAQSEQLSKINDLVDGTIDHFDKDDAMDLLYAIKGVLKNG